ncbi:MAG: Ig-like domain-containing protein [Microlunatus sp.]|nr:Ig-like domain-containing protein [Microlunatus sp.]
MSERRGHRPPPVLLFVTAAALAIGGCSNPGAGANVTVTEPTTVLATQGPAGAAPSPDAAPATLADPPPAAPGGGITVVVPPAGEAVAESTDAGSAVTPTGSAGDSSAVPTTSAAPKPTPKPKPAATVMTSPGPGSIGVDPRQRISLTAKGGKLLWVKVINPEGKVVGQATVNAATWNWLPELGFGRKYTVRTATRSTAGVDKVTESTFTTLQPKAKVSVSITPSNGQTVGVGQPIVFRFSAPIQDSYRRKVEAMIRIDRTIGQPGAFRWFSKTELHWRPAQFWKSGSKVVATLDIYARQMSPGAYGQADLRSGFVVGPRMTSIVDAKKHTMEVYRDFKLLRVIPVSLGNNKYPTYNGIHVVTEKHRDYVMDSSTWGLKGAGAYRTKVKYATRISDSGEFVHGAPWSEYAQGHSNVSHGCINMTDAAARWFQDLSRPGDVVTVKNSVGKTMAVGDRYGAWHQPWGKY